MNYCQSRLFQKALKNFKGQDIYQKKRENWEKKWCYINWGEKKGYASCAV